MFANSRGMQVMQSYAPFMLCYPLFMQNDVNYISAKLIKFYYELLLIFLILRCYTKQMYTKCALIMEEV